ATAQCRRGARAWLCKEENRRQEIRRLEPGEGSDCQAGEGEEVNATQVARLRTAPAIRRGLSLSVDRPPCDRQWNFAPLGTLAKAKQSILLDSSGCSPTE